MKKIFATLSILFIGILPIVAQTVEHVVERGETISSIASKYKISESQLLEANPTAKDLFYAGMVLTIPNVMENTIASNTNQVLNNNKKDTDNSNNTGYNSQNNSQSKSENSSQTISFESDKRYPNLKIDKGDKSFFMKYRYDINTFKKQTDDYNYKSGLACDFLIGGRYFIVNNLFVDGALGLSYASTSMTPKKDIKNKTETTSYGLELPVHFGGALPIGQRGKISALTGPVFGYPLSTTTKKDGKKQDYKTDKKISVNWELGAELSIYGVLVGADIMIPLQKSVIPLSNTYCVYIGLEF